MILTEIIKIEISVVAEAVSITAQFVGRRMLGELST
jgi:hypothetical protein